MITVYKYPVSPNSVHGKAYGIKIRTCKGAKPLSVGKQGSQVCVWMEVDTKQDEAETITVYCVGTGFGEVPDGKRFLGTVIDGAYVWHFYV